MLRSIRDFESESVRAKINTKPFLFKSNKPENSLIDGQTYLVVESGNEIFTYTTSNISDSYFSSQNEGRIEVLFSIRDFNTNEILSSQSADLTLISEWLEKNFLILENYRK